MLPVLTASVLLLHPPYHRNDGDRVGGGSRPFYRLLWVLTFRPVVCLGLVMGMQQLAMLSSMVLRNDRVGRYPAYRTAFSPSMVLVGDRRRYYVVSTCFKDTDRLDVHAVYVPFFMAPVL